VSFLQLLPRFGGSSAISGSTHFFGPEFKFRFVILSAVPLPWKDTTQKKKFSTFFPQIFFFIFWPTPLRKADPAERHFRTWKKVKKRLFSENWKILKPVCVRTPLLAQETAALRVLAEGIGFDSSSKKFRRKNEIFAYPLFQDSKNCGKKFATISENKISTEQLRA